MYYILITKDKSCVKIGGFLTEYLANLYAKEKQLTNYSIHKESDSCY